MILTKDSYTLSKKHGLRNVVSYTVTFTGFKNIVTYMHSDNTEFTREITDTEPLGTHIKSKAEWLEKYPEYFI